MHTLRHLAVIVILLLFSFSGQAQAISMQSLVEGQQITVFDKVFSNWLLFSSTTLSPNLTQIEVQPLGDDPLNPGLSFSFNDPLQFTAAFSEQEEFFDFGFTVSTTTGLSLIKGNSLSFTGFNFSNDPLAGGLIEILEILRDGTDSFGEKLVSADNLFQDFELFDNLDFQPRSEINVDVLTTLFADFNDDFLSVESFEMRFSQVPEPGTFVLLGTGFGLLCLWGRRQNN